jgi:hypothetical protein
LALGCTQVVGRERGIRIPGENEPQVELALPAGRGDRRGGDLVEQVGELGRFEHLLEAVERDDVARDHQAGVLA